MEKSKVILSINDSVMACESLANKSVRNGLYKDCVSSAIDCADAGIMLIMKMPQDHTPRTLMKQYIHICKKLAQKWKNHEDREVRSIINKCDESAEICLAYLQEEKHKDHYFLSPITKLSA